MTDQWLLVKRGLYYMPNDCGYTGIRDHAGRYSYEDATARLSEGIAMIRLDKAAEFTTACFDDLARNHLTKQRDEARAALNDILQLTGKHDLTDAWKIAERVTKTTF